MIHIDQHYAPALLSVFIAISIRKTGIFGTRRIDLWQARSFRLGFDLFRTCRIVTTRTILLRKGRAFVITGCPAGQIRQTLFLLVWFRFGLDAHCVSRLVRLRRSVDSGGCSTWSSCPMSSRADTADCNINIDLPHICFCRQSHMVWMHLYSLQNPWWGVERNSSLEIRIMHEWTADWIALAERYMDKDRIFKCECASSIQWSNWIVGQCSFGTF